MIKLERRVAYYSDNTTVEAKTTRKKFDDNGLVAVVSLYNDGTRELEYSKYKHKDEIQDKKEKAVYLIAQARLEYKSDGGTNPEIEQLIRESR